MSYESGLWVLSVEIRFREERKLIGEGNNFSVRSHTCQLRSLAQDYYFLSNLWFILETLVPSHNYGEKGGNILHLKSVNHSSCLSLQRRKTFRRVRPGAGT